MKSWHAHKFPDQVYFEKVLQYYVAFWLIDMVLNFVYFFKLSSAHLKHNQIGLPPIIGLHVKSNIAGDFVHKCLLAEVMHLKNISKISHMITINYLPIWKNICDGISDCDDEWDESPHICEGIYII